MKNNLPWLSRTERDALYIEFEKVVKSELVRRHWGVIQKSASAPLSHTKLYILDMRGLLLVVGTLRYLLRNHGSHIYYRGQSADYKHITPSIYRCSGSLLLTEKAARQKRLDDRLNAISGVFDPKPKAIDEREALAQHYGLPTRCIDLVDHVQTAAWFAFDRSSHYVPSREDSVGHIYALAADQAGEWSKIVDLRQKPTNWLRPHMQQAYMMFLGPRANRQSVFDYSCAAHFIVPRPLLRIWSNYDSISRDIMFPPESLDQGAYYWQQAVDALVVNKLIVSGGGTIVP